ncbi:MAG: STELLO glycosyltransferase family protein [Candidatus Pelagibacter sp.]
MNKLKKIALVITSINKPNKVIKKYYSLSKKNRVNFIIIGDKKTPEYPSKYNFYNLKSQKNFKFSLNKSLPINSYSRKNIGYLVAMQNKSKIIIETDDDNFPKSTFFHDLELQKKLNLLSGPKWINIFKIFQKKNKDSIWPRGFPLDEINKIHKIKVTKKLITSPIQQRLCDGNPDVDAIFRLTKKNKFHTFDKKNYALNNKSICPFNSQNTLWHEQCFPIMYLPSYVTMRATDIWRGFIALRILRNYNWNLSFLKSTVIQNRNVHDLLDDFNLEYPVYKDTKILNDILYNVKLSDKKNNMLINFFKCYEKLVEEKILEKNELELVYKWINDISKLYTNYKKI